MEVERCKHCWEEPVVSQVGYDWCIYCNCLLYSAYSPGMEYFPKYADAVEHWNKHSGRETANEGAGLAVQSEGTCTCDSQSLLWLGCTCEYARRKHQR